MRRHTWELVEFLYDVLKVREFPWAEFPHKVGLHAEYIVSPDMSCVMHQKGCAERLGSPLKFIHIAQVLNGAQG